MKELASAMAKAQAEIRSAKKDAANPFFKSKYADLASVVSACRDAFAKHGLSVVQSTDFDDHGMWLETYLLHSSGEFIKGRYPIRPLKTDPQSVGSAISYAKRYTYAAMAGVVTSDEDDDGNAASDRKDDEPIDDHAAQQAKAFVRKAIKEIGECKTTAALQEWHKTWTRHVIKLRETHAEEARILDAAFTAQRDALGRQAAE